MYSGFETIAGHLFYRSAKKLFFLKKKID